MKSSVLSLVYIPSVETNNWPVPVVALCCLNGKSRILERTRYCELHHDAGWAELPGKNIMFPLTHGDPLAHGHSYRIRSIWHSSTAFKGREKPVRMTEGLCLLQTVYPPWPINHCVLHLIRFCHPRTYSISGIGSFWTLSKCWRNQQVRIVRELSDHHSWNCFLYIYLALL